MTKITTYNQIIDLEKSDIETYFDGNKYLIQCVDRPNIKIYFSQDAAQEFVNDFLELKKQNDLKKKTKK